MDHQELASLIIRKEKSGIKVAILLQPRSSCNKITGIVAGRLKIKVTPPLDNAANQQVCKFLAKKIGCPSGSVQVIQGQKNRQKTIFIKDITETDFLTHVTQKVK